jgi:glutamine synthetase
MPKYKIEYIWLDGYKPEPHLRSKTKTLELDKYNGELAVLPVWSFDGSSTRQAEGNSSDCLIKPVRTYQDTSRKNGWMVMCEGLNPDGSPHASNTRHALPEEEDYWFGFEQEFTLVIDGRPLGFPKNGFPAPQGMYYCSVGHGNVAGRDIIEDHYDLCLDAGLDITGINAEVMLGQWEFQVFGKGARKASDDLWISRYLLFRLAEKYHVNIEFAPKPVEGDWNGSGLHCNFSNHDMRENGGKDTFDRICEAFGKYKEEHIAEYGSGHDKRLTGLHETQHIDTFSYGVSDRGASLRIPVSVAENGYKGYIEDRRPASNADPYRITGRIIQTIEGAKVPA